jgi:hypothetical protein
MGVVAGVLGAAPDKGREKDFRAYASLPGFEELRRFLRAAKVRGDVE